jgi:hypothetical protein
MIIKKIIKNNKYSLVSIILSSFILITLAYKVITVNQHPIQQRTDASGFALSYMQDLFPAWFQLDLYPISSNVANKILKKKTNVNNYIDTSIKMSTGGLLGEYLKMPYMLPNYILRFKPSPKLSNQILSIISILFLLIIGYKRKQIWFVYFCLLSIILTDYYVYENFYRENIFGVSISAYLIIFSFLTLLNNYVIVDTLILIIISIIISALGSLRTELYCLIFSVIIYLLYNDNIRQALLKIMLTIFLIYCFSSFIDYDMQKRVEKTNDVIAEVNGVVYPGPVAKMHTFFHPLWIGLGDNKYGRELGFKWEDRIARVRVAKLRPDIYKISDMCANKICIYFDKYKVYPAYAENMPGYQETLRNDIWRAFKNNPRIFLLIYFEKLKNNITKLSSIHINNNFVSKKDRNNFNILYYLFRDSPPHKLQHKNKYFIFHGNQILIFSIIFLIGIIIINKYNKKCFNYKIVNKFQLSFIYSSLPLAMPAIINSSLGATYNSIYHLGILAMVLCLILKLNHVR